MSDTLTAGRELDALVAEKVMGWTGVTSEAATYHNANGYIVFCNGWPDYTVPWHGREPGSWDEGSGYAEILPYSTDIGSAWLVVEAMRTKGYRVAVLTRMYGWGCNVEGSPRMPLVPVRTKAPTAPEAICLAALKACEPE